MSQIKIIIRRFIAYGIDWYIGGLMINLPIVLIYGCVFNQTQMQTNLLVIGENNIIVALLSGIFGVIFGIFYFFIIPLRLWPGQTLGKRILKMKIIQNDTQEISFKNLFLRQIIGITIFEGAVFSLTTTLRQFLDLILTTDIFTSDPVMIFGYLITFISCLLVVFKGRALHDFIGATKIEYLQ